MCNELSSCFKGYIVDSCTDHGFFRGQFCLWVTGRLGFLLLFGIGCYRLFSYFLKKGEEESEKVKALNLLEGLGLAFILSLDSIAVGIGTGLVQSGQVMLVIGSFLAGIAVMEAGWMLGHGTRHILNRDLSWLSGVCLLLLAIGSLRG